MKYLLAMTLSVYSFAGLASSGFRGLQELEILDIHKNVSVTTQVLQLPREQHEVVLNYLFVAASSANIEHTFVRKYAEFQYYLARLKDAAVRSQEDMSVAAREFAKLNRLVQEKAELSVALKCIEVYIDGHEEYDRSITSLRESLTEVMTAFLENRRQVIDMVLAESDNRLADGTFSILARFCKMLVSEPELLVNKDTLALGRVDIMHNLSRQLEDKITSVEEVKQAMDEIVYFTLLITHHYFKECYRDLYQKYTSSYASEPAFLFADSEKQTREVRHVLPQDF